ncbi:hypothetical protein [Salinibacterium sp. SWN167]|uniref:hypothetical protein n=1 Tax=Salinibacterium sp. SWN167 TaxID=2792054 RepID=UPI0018CDC71E|nr:hypothetical protein [Salinibacterium sp. SWN167]MBH0082446.1 hypothetical protein [Salinibacterium sp. SWN167]
MREPKPKKIAKQFELLFAELAQRRDSQTRRLGIAGTIASILIATGAILVGFSLESESWTLLSLAAAVPALAAVGYGIAALFPKVVSELDPAVYRNKLLSSDEVQAQLWLSDRLIELVEKREYLLESRFGLVKWGIFWLFLAIVGLIVTRAMA